MSELDKNLAEASNYSIYKVGVGNYLIHVKDENFQLTASVSKDEDSHSVNLDKMGIFYDDHTNQFYCDFKEGELMRGDLNDILIESYLEKRAEEKPTLNFGEPGHTIYHGTSSDRAGKPVHYHVVKQNPKAKEERHEGFSESCPKCGVEKEAKEKKDYLIEDVQKAEHTLEPLKCKFCGSNEVTYNQGIGDAHCADCDKWQLPRYKRGGDWIQSSLKSIASAPSEEGETDYERELKPYVGVSKDNKSEVFNSVVEPTEASHGHKYKYVIGPFDTKEGAEFMAQYGQNNPHLQTVDDAERLAKQRRMGLHEPFEKGGN